MRRWLAALLGLIAPLAQQRPALLDGVPMPHASLASVCQSPAASNAAHVISDACGHGGTHHGNDPAPRMLWCCELALVPVVATPWQAPAIIDAVVVRVALHRPSPVVAPSTAQSQTRLPYATAPPMRTA